MFSRNSKRKNFRQGKRVYSPTAKKTHTIEKEEGKEEKEHQREQGVLKKQH